MAPNTSVDSELARSPSNLPSVMERAEATAEDTRDVILGRPVVAMVAAGVIGFALGAIIFKSRSQRNVFGDNFAVAQRAAELATWGTMNTMQNIRKRLRREGYSPSELQGQAKRYVRQLISAARG